MLRPYKTANLLNKAPLERIPVFARFCLCFSLVILNQVPDLIRYWFRTRRLCLCFSLVILNLFQDPVPLLLLLPLLLLET